MTLWIQLLATLLYKLGRVHIQSNILSHKMKESWILSSKRVDFMIRYSWSKYRRKCCWNVIVVVCFYHTWKCDQCV